MEENKTEHEVSVRDHFAIQILNGLLSGNPNNTYFASLSQSKRGTDQFTLKGLIKEMTHLSYILADAMREAREIK